MELHAYAHCQNFDLAQRRSHYNSASTEYICVPYLFHDIHIFHYSFGVVGVRLHALIVSAEYNQFTVCQNWSVVTNIDSLLKGAFHLFQH